MPRGLRLEHQATRFQIPYLVGSSCVNEEQMVDILVLPTMEEQIFDVSVSLVKERFVGPVAPERLSTVLFEQPSRSLAELARLMGCSCGRR